MTIYRPAFSVNYFFAIFGGFPRQEKVEVDRLHQPFCNQFDIRASSFGCFSPG